MIKSIFDESEEQIKREIEGEEFPPAAPEIESTQAGSSESQADILALSKLEETVLSEPQTENIKLSEADSILEIPHLREPEFVAEAESAVAPESQTPPDESFFSGAGTKTETYGQPLLVQPAFAPESKAETIRKSGLAYAAGIVLFGSIVFMLVIGWIFDWLLGTSPWGIVGGIVLGATLGFYQFFKLTAQIINDKN